MKLDKQAHDKKGGGVSISGSKQPSDMSLSFDAKKVQNVLDKKVFDALTERGLLENLDAMITLDPDHLAELLSLPIELVETQKFRDLVINTLKNDNNSDNLSINISNISISDNPIPDSKFKSREGTKVITAFDVLTKFSTEASCDTFEENIELETETKVSNILPSTNEDQKIDDNLDDKGDKDNLNAAAADDDDDDDDDDDGFNDDESFIQPIYEISKGVRDSSNTVNISLESGEELSNLVDSEESAVQTNEFTKDSTIDENTVDNQKSILKNNKSTNFSVKLTDYYESFAMIFPFSYTQTGDSRLYNCSLLRLLIYPMM